MEKTVLLCLAGLTACALRAELEPATPESQGVPSAAIARWLDACEESFAGRFAGRLHGFVLLRHGRTIAEGSWKPFDTLRETHMLYSHSKSFTSTAVGLLVDEGLLDLDERVASLFPDKLPADPGLRLLSLRVRDLLTMNDGMPFADAEKKDLAGDWVKAFLANEIASDPGTKFKYDSCATFVLAAIVARKTGQDMMSFLRTRLFDPIGIGKVWSTTSPDGIPCGGWGMNMTTRDLARFGQLYLQEGRWGDRRILSPDWVRLATARQTWSGWINVGPQKIGTGSDWQQGYGFQFWRCRHNAYRADGACGQLTVVMPDQDAVLSVHAGLGNMQRELDLIWEHLLPAMQAGPLPEDPAASGPLAQRCRELSIAPVEGVCEGADRFLGDYVLEPNGRGFRTLRLGKDAQGGWTMSLAAEAFPGTVPLGFGTWARGEMHVDSERYEALGGLIGAQPTAASAAVRPDGTFCGCVFLTGTTGVLDFTIREEGGRFLLDGALRHIIRSGPFRGVRREAPARPANVPALLNGRPWAERRAELLKVFEQNQFGVRPIERPADQRFEVSPDVPILRGQGIRRDVRFSCTGPNGDFSFPFHAYLPTGAKKAACFVSICLTPRLKKEHFDPVAEDPSIPSMPIREILKRGHAVVAFANGDVAADDRTNCFDTGVFRAFGPTAATRGETSWGALSAWAWAASRIADWVEAQPELDARRIAVIGHSRGGKTALWAGATDGRFALTCVNDSGCGGAKLNHMDQPFSEHYRTLLNRFLHWTAPAFRAWSGQEERLEVDSHMLLALVAPRLCAVGSGTEDAWAGPAAERAAAELAAPAWEIQGAKGFGSGIRHHFRSGPHNLLPEDWAHYMEALESLSVP